MLLVTSGGKCGLGTTVKNTGSYSKFQLSPLLLLNKYQYNCNANISSASAVIKDYLIGKNLLTVINLRRVHFLQNVPCLPSSDNLVFIQQTV